MFLWPRTQAFVVQPEAYSVFSHCPTRLEAFVSISLVGPPGIQKQILEDSTTGLHCAYPRKLPHGTTDHCQSIGGHNAATCKQKRTTVEYIKRSIFHRKFHFLTKVFLQVWKVTQAFFVRSSMLNLQFNLWSRITPGYFMSVEKNPSNSS